jgi:hypothetical protein
MLIPFYGGEVRGSIEGKYGLSERIPGYAENELRRSIRRNIEILLAAIRRPSPFADNRVTTEMACGFARRFVACF